MECTPSNPQALIAIRWFDVGATGVGGSGAWAVDWVGGGVDVG